MDRSKYDRATLFLEYIKHIDDIQEFICNARDVNAGIVLREDKPRADPKIINLTNADVDMLLRTLAREKEDLEAAFAAL